MIAITWYKTRKIDTYMTTANMLIAIPSCGSNFVIPTTKYNMIKSNEYTPARMM
jgi:hypothetical protein